MIPYSQWILTTQDPIFITAMVVSLVLTLVMYFVVGGIISVATKGRREHYWASTYFWSGFFIFFLILPITIIFGIIFPVWLKMFGAS